MTPFKLSLMTLSHTDVSSLASGPLSHISVSRQSPLLLSSLPPLLQGPTASESPTGIMQYTSSITQSAVSQVRTRVFFCSHSFSQSLRPSTTRGLLSRNFCTCHTGQDFSGCRHCLVQHTTTMWQEPVGFMRAWGLRHMTCQKSPQSKGAHLTT